MQKPIIIYDGNCGFCNSLAYKISKYDSKRNFEYTSLQSSEAKELLSHLETIPDSIIVKTSQSTLFESSAVLYILNNLPYPLKLLRVFGIFPRKVLDKVYRFVARNRYIISRNSSCKIIDHSK